MKKNKEIYKYIIFAFFISWLFWFFRVVDTSGYVISPILVNIGMIGLFGPFFAALIIEGKNFKSYLKSAIDFKYKNKYLYFSILIGPFIVIVSYLITVLFTKTKFELGIPFVMWVPVAIIILFVGGPIEEFGWRGFLLPKLLNKYSVFIATLILGFIHGIWHLPLHFIESTTQYVIPIYQFVLVTIVGAFIYTWIYIKTNRKLSSVIIHHWTGNLASGIFMYWTNTEGRIIFFIVQLIVVLILFMHPSFKLEKVVE